MTFANHLREDDLKIERIEQTWFVMAYLDEKYKKYEDAYKKEHGESPAPVHELTEKERVNDSLVLALAGNDIRKFGDYCENYDLSELFEFYVLNQAFVI